MGVGEHSVSRFQQHPEEDILGTPSLMHWLDKGKPGQPFSFSDECFERTLACEIFSGFYHRRPLTRSHRARARIRDKIDGDTFCRDIEWIIASGDENFFPDAAWNTGEGFDNLYAVWLHKLVYLAQLPLYILVARLYF
jgi:hypothetical protein